MRFSPDCRQAGRQAGMTDEKTGAQRDECRPSLSRSKAQVLSIPKSNVPPTSPQARRYTSKVQFPVKWVPLWVLKGGTSPALKGRQEAAPAFTWTKAFIPSWPLLGATCLYPQYHKWSGERYTADTGPSPKLGSLESPLSWFSESRRLTPSMQDPHLRWLELKGSGADTARGGLVLPLKLSHTWCLNQKSLSYDRRNHLPLVPVGKMAALTAMWPLRTYVKHSCQRKHRGHVWE